MASTIEALDPTAFPTAQSEEGGGHGLGLGPHGFWGWYGTILKGWCDCKQTVLRAFSKPRHQLRNRSYFHHTGLPENSLVACMRRLWAIVLGTCWVQVGCTDLGLRRPGFVIYGLGFGLWVGGSRSLAVVLRS